MLDYAHLEALLAVEREKSFEGAARALGITSSAISQRIKLLEERVGAVLLNRQTPVSTTNVGAELCRHAEMVMMLEGEVIKRNKEDIGHSSGRYRKLKIAVNDDSLSSWFMGVLEANAASNNPYLLEISIADQDYSINQMKAGSALAAISIDKNPVQGFQSTYLGIISALAAAIEARDPYTVGHSARVTQYAVAIAESMELSSEEVEEVRLAGLLHDLGKIGVPDSILNKPGRLNDEEFTVIKMHPALSMRIIEPLPHLGNIIPIIYHHHERYDGQGYVEGKSGERIPLGARIIAVADSYEAMTSDRPYRVALSRKEAMSELRSNAGSQFDPDVVSHFLELLDKTIPA